MKIPASVGPPEKFSTTGNTHVWDEALSIIRIYEGTGELGLPPISNDFIYTGGYGLYTYLREIGEWPEDLPFYRDLSDIDILCVNDSGPIVQPTLNAVAKSNPVFRFTDEGNSAPFRNVICLTNPSTLRVVFHMQNWAQQIEYYRYLLNPTPPAYKVLTKPRLVFNLDESHVVCTPQPTDLFLLKLDVVRALHRTNRVYPHDLDLAVLLNHWVNYRLESWESLTSRVNELVRSIYTHFTSPTPVQDGHALLFALLGSTDRYLNYTRCNLIPRGFDTLFPAPDISTLIRDRVYYNLQNQIR